MSGIIFDDVMALLSINTTVSDDSVAVDLFKITVDIIKGINVLHVF